MDKLLNFIASHVRAWMIMPARFLHKISGGKIRPNHITLVSMLGHIFVLWALWQSRPIVAALCLMFFGLMDSLDGALARLQKNTSVQGMFYDAVSDRAKEVLLYVGVVLFVMQPNPSFIQSSSERFILEIFNDLSWLPVAVLGCSLLISYIKAKGEMAIANNKAYSKQDINRIFADGIARYEVRMAFVVVSLLTGNLLLALVVLFFLLILTIFQRLIRISRALSGV